MIVVHFQLLLVTLIPLPSQEDLKKFEAQNADFSRIARLESIYVILMKKVCIRGLEAEALEMTLFFEEHG